jgi:hypothetical protein
VRGRDARLRLQGLGTPAVSSVFGLAGATPAHRLTTLFLLNLDCCIRRTRSLRVSEIVDEIVRMMQLRTELMKIVGCLNGSSIDYALCGGLAVAVHGYVRATKDIDILIRQEALGEALRALALIGYDLEAGLFKFNQGSDSEMQLFRVSRAEGTSLTTLDLMLVTPVLFEVWNDRELVRTFDTDIKVVSKTALIKMKQLAGRLQDLADIETLRSISEPDGA